MKIISTTQATDKIGVATTDQGKVSYWLDAPFASQLTPGAEGNAVTEIKPGKPKTTGGSWPDTTWLKSWEPVVPVQSSATLARAVLGAPTEQVITPQASTSPVQALERREVAIIAQVALKAAVDNAGGAKEAPEILADANMFFDGVLAMIKRV